ncbi:hypothetical protein M441DRAFT_57224 [Trichoderma asperellum CBS 433.97]|uniref:Uncharacterized protein n=1 Tax=Trichoderma asperellum (strain ATCC 204424 / CBS 433.97 / NBRC 101777) TaxID=1042311 RepID=A0A2T3ZCF2_TRIA4|nr:hypothetical protein M441DRAFT_57224 [Trichoderma asperellum CBS 433.97]PTB42481.1 hypothetical protein M441DRAFT_57224 [Trichoderma asperellum CBS 433.97]
MPLSSKKNQALAAEQQNIAASGAAGPTYGTGPGHANAANANLPGPAPFTAGPHRHDVLNKLDPTVDSGTGGMQVLTGSHHNAGMGGVPGQAPVQGRAGGVMGSNNPYHGGNVADPTLPNAGNYYTMGTNVVPGSNAAPRNVPEGTYGPHTSRVANAADPRVDSDADHRRRVGLGTGAGSGAAARGGVGAGSGGNSRPIFPPGVGGPAPTTAGPHRHDVLNKLDPTVDSRSATTVDATGRKIIP